MYLSELYLVDVQACWIDAEEALLQHFILLEPGVVV